MVSLQAPKKYRQQEPLTSDSETDDCVVAESEVALAKQDAKHWRQRYSEKCNENEKLHDIIKSLQACIQDKLLSSKLTLLFRVVYFCVQIR